MKKQGVNLYRRFDSLTAFQSYLDSNKVTDTFAGHVYSAAKDYDFTRTDSYEQAVSLMLYGDKQLAKMLDDAGLSAARTKIYRERDRRKLVSTVVGAVPNVPAYISGSPNSMIVYRQHKVKQHVVNVAYNCAVSGGTSSRTIIESAVRLLTALMKIEAAGTQVNLYAVNMDSTRDGVNSFSIRIKTAGQKFDLLKMCYPIAHPSMNRRHKFRYTEVTEGVPESFRFGYGCPETDDAKIKKHFDSHGLKLDRAFNCQSLQSMSVERIIEAITTGE